MTATLDSIKIYIVEPEEAVNEMLNPSGEIAIAGYYAGNNCTVTQSAEQVRYGKYSVKGVPTGLNTRADIYQTRSMSASQQYSASASIFGVAGVRYTIRIQTTGGTDVATSTFTGNGRWQRKSVTATISSTASYNVMVSRDADQNTTAAFYVDGWLCKVGADNLYFDGDSRDPHLGFPVFWWLGAPHVSQSQRSGLTRAGGTLLDLSQYFFIRGVDGLGLTRYTTNSSGLSLGGELYQNSHPESRRFSILCTVTADYPQPRGIIMEKMARIQRAVNPKRMPTDQPLRILFVGYDEQGVEASESVIIEAVYLDGLEGTLADRLVEFVVRFKQHNPLIVPDAMRVVSLSPSAAVASTSYGSLLKLSLETGASAVIDIGDAVNELARGVTLDDNLGMYIYGYFQNLGSTSGDHIVYRSNAGTISALGSGVANPPLGYDGIMCCVRGPDGKIYIGGSFAAAGGVANTKAIARWNPGTSSWEAVGSGCSDATGYVVRGILFDSYGRLFAAGNFTVMGGVTVNNFAMFNGTSWVALGGTSKGVSYVVGYQPIAILPTGLVIISASNPNDDPTITNLFSWNPNTSTWAEFGAPDGGVSTVTYDQITGRLYVEGTFTEIGGVPADCGIAYFDGANWHILSNPEGTVQAYDAFTSPFGQIVLITSMYSVFATGIHGPAIWSGGSWRFLEIFSSTYSSGFQRGAYLPSTKEIVIGGYQEAAFNYYVPAVTNIENEQCGTIYPTITLDGVGYIVHSLWNRSNGDRIFFGTLYVPVGEKIEIVFTPTGYSAVSNIRGDVRSIIQPGSSPTFRLKPGDNYVSCTVYPAATGGVTIPVKFAPGNFISLDETVYS